MAVVPMALLAVTAVRQARGYAAGECKQRREQQGAALRLIIMLLIPAARAKLTLGPR